MRKMINYKRVRRIKATIYMFMVLLFLIPALLLLFVGLRLLNILEPYNNVRAETSASVAGAPGPRTSSSPSFAPAGSGEGSSSASISAAAASSRADEGQASHESTEASRRAEEEQVSQFSVPQPIQSASGQQSSSETGSAESASGESAPARSAPAELSSSPESGGSKPVSQGASARDNETSAVSDTSSGNNAGAAGDTDIKIPNTGLPKPGE